MLYYTFTLIRLIHLQDSLILVICAVLLRLCVYMCVCVWGFFQLRPSSSVWVTGALDDQVPMFFPFVNLAHTVFFHMCMDLYYYYYIYILLLHYRLNRQLLNNLYSSQSVQKRHYKITLYKRIADLSLEVHSSSRKCFYYVSMNINTEFWKISL